MEKRRADKKGFGRRVPKADKKRKPRMPRENPNINQGSPDKYHMSVLNSKLNTAMARVSELEWEKNNLERNAASMAETIKKLSRSLNYYKSKVSSYDNEIKTMKSQADTDTSKDRETKNLLIRYESQILTKEDIILEQKEEIERLKKQLGENVQVDSTQKAPVKENHIIADNLLLDILTYYEDIKKTLEKDDGSNKVKDDNRDAIDKVNEVIAKLKEDQGEIGSQVLVSNLNDVVDYLKETSYYSRNKEVLKESLVLILKSIKENLDELGVEEIPTQGVKFDSTKHVAILSEDNGDYEDGDVIEEISKGYTMKGIIIKPANVKVCKK